MGGDVVQPQSGDVADGRRQTYRSANVGRPSLIFERDVVVDGFFKGDFLDHLPAAHPRRQLFQQLPFSPQRADAGGSIQLVAGKGVQVASQFLNVHVHVGDGLGAVNQHNGVRPVFPGKRGDLLHGIDCSERVGDVAHGHDAGAGGKQVPVGLHIQRLARSQRDYLEDRARAFAEHLPGDDVGVVLTGGQDNFVPRLDRART